MQGYVLSPVQLPICSVFMSSCYVILLLNGLDQRLYIIRAALQQYNNVQADNGNFTLRAELQRMKALDCKADAPAVGCAGLSRLTQSRDTT